MAVLQARDLSELPVGDAIAAGRPMHYPPPYRLETARRLAELLGRPSRPLNPLNGVEKPPELAIIDEPACIGCTTESGWSKSMTTLIPTCSCCRECMAAG